MASPASDEARGTRRWHSRACESLRGSLRAVNGMRAYRSFDRESRIMDARFAATRLQLAGKTRSGTAHQSGDDRQLAVISRRLAGHNSLGWMRVPRSQQRCNEQA